MRLSSDITVKILVVIFWFISRASSSPQNDCVHGDATILTIPGCHCKISKTADLSTETLDFTFIEKNCVKYDEAEQLNIVTNFRKISGDIFEKLPRIEILEAINTNFSVITLEDHGLTSINIAENQLASFSIEITESLIYMNISHNDLEEFYLENRNNRTNSSLETLDLAHNKISNMDIFSDIPSLIYLNLSHNLMRRIPPIFYNCPNLIDLNLSYNRIRHISLKNLEFLEYLQTLDLTGNRLVSIDYKGLLEMFTGLSVLGIQNNPLDCEILKKMIEYFDKNDKDIIKKSACSSRTNYGGICCEYKMKKSTLAQKFQSIITNKPICELDAPNNNENPENINYLKSFMQMVQFENTKTIRKYLNITVGNIHKNLETLNSYCKVIMDYFMIIMSLVIFLMFWSFCKIFFELEDDDVKPKNQ